MDSRCTVLLAIVVLAAIAGSRAKDQSPAAKLRRDYDKINDYLEKNEASGDPVHNMEKIEEALEKKSMSCVLFSGSSMISTMKKLQALTTMAENSEFCRSKGKDLMLELDSGLADESRSTNREYPLTRVNRILEHYVFKNVFLCNFYKTPKLNYALKQVDYDHINRYLVESLPEEQDIEVNMAKAEELLNSLSSREGALAKALEQFLEMRSTSDEETCGTKGMVIFFKNDKSARLDPEHKYRTPIRRVDKIFEHYARAHEALCRKKIRKSFGLKAKDLDPETYRNILALVSANYLPRGSLSKLISDIKEKEISEDFTIPAMVEYAQSTSNSTEECPWLQMIKVVESKKLYRLASAMSADTPDSKYLISHLDEISGKRIVYEDGLRDLLNRYFFNPCSRYLDALKELEQIDNYYSELDEKHFRSIKGNFDGDLSYYLSRGAYLACKFINSNRKTIYDNLRLTAMFHHTLKIYDD